MICPQCGRCLASHEKVCSSCISDGIPPENAGAGWVPPLSDASPSEIESEISVLADYLESHRRTPLDGDISVAADPTMLNLESDDARGPWGDVERSTPNSVPDQETTTGTSQRVASDGTTSPDRYDDFVQTMLKNRVVFLGGAIDEALANLIVAHLLFLQRDDDSQAITIYVNSPGGEITASLVILDTMRQVRCPVDTVGVGNVAGSAIMLLAAGGNRLALPSCEVTFAQSQGLLLPSTEPEQLELERATTVLVNELVQMTYMSEKVIRDCMDSHMTFSAAEAVDCGIIDALLTEDAQGAGTNE